MSDVLTLSSRCLRLSRRQIDGLITSLLLPVMLMVIFVELFGGAIQTGTKYVTYVVPGVLILCTAFGSAMTAVSVCQDVSGGIVDRFRAMDVRGAALLAGHVTSSIVRNAVSTMLVVAISASRSASALTQAQSSGSRRLECSSPSLPPSPGLPP